MGAAALQCSVSDRWQTGPPLEKFRSLAKLSCVAEEYFEEDVKEESS